MSGIMRNASGVMRVSPNPMRAGFVTVRIGTRSELSTTSVTSLRMYDAVGRSIGHWLLPIGCSSSTLDLRGLRAGVYMVKLTSGSYTTSQKLVVQE